jgi:phage-related tail protein
MTGTRLRKRFGSIAVKKGFISVEQLIEAVKIQVKEDVEKGESRPIGRILIDLGFLTEEQYEAVRKSLSEYNLIA